MERRTFIHIRFPAADAPADRVGAELSLMYGNEPTAAQFCCNIAIGHRQADRCALSMPQLRVR
jgi:hypothetical protein